MFSATGSARAVRLSFALVVTLLLTAVPAQADLRGDAFGGARVGTAAQPLVAAAPPPGFTDTAAITGLTAPTAVRFAPDGRVFVGEKRGRIVMYDSISDPTPTVWADFNQNVHDFWDRGLLGMALDPNFATRPY